MEPTTQQLRTYYRVSLMASNTFRPINVIRLDERNKRLFVLVGDTIEVEIFPNGEAFIK